MRKAVLAAIAVIGLGLAGCSSGEGTAHPVEPYRLVSPTTTSLPPVIDGGGVYGTQILTIPGKG